MKIDDTKLYTSADTYFEGPDGMKNEVAMWYVAAGLLMRELAKRKGNLPFGGLGKVQGYSITPDESDTLDVLDLCSGPGNFVNHLSFVFPWLKVICTDVNETFLNAGQKQFDKWSFIKADVTKIDLKKQFDCITASSAYHHIEHNQKIDFLKTIKNHLKLNGFAIICENFLPEYSSETERNQGIELYYDELVKYYKEGNATETSIKAIDEVYRLELTGVEEHKVTRTIFERQVNEVGLLIDIDIVVWQSEKLRPSNAGSHVLILTHAQK